jgi:aspartate aminotransferase
MMPEDTWAPYLRPQARFDELVERAFREFGPRLMDLSYANAYDGPEPRVVEAIRQALDQTGDLSFQYTPYGGKTTTRRLIATQFQSRFGIAMNYQDVVLTPGAMSALNLAFRCLCRDGDEVLVLAPCWLDYPLYLSHLQIPFRFVPLASDKHLDLAAIEQAIGPKTRAIIFSHPGCPTGVMCSPSELEGLARILKDAESRWSRSIYVISDEVHRDLAWGEMSFTTAMQFHPRTLVIYSFGKALFLQGQRIGYVAVSPKMEEREEVRTRLRQLVRVMGFCTPTTLMQRVVPQILDYRPPLEEVRERQRMVREALKESGFTVCNAEATFFVYAQSPLEDDFAFSERMAARGVLILPSSLFYERGFFRISVTAKKECIAAALPLLAEAAQGN